jgi:phosphotransferase system enzyme I (PtsI)
MKTDVSEQITLHGIAASPGIAIGPFCIFAGHKLNIEEHSLKLKDLDDEVQRFREAVAASRRDLLRSRDLVISQQNDEIAEILDGQIALMGDEIFLQEIVSKIIENRKNAESVVFAIFRERQEYFHNLESEYFRDRAWDLKALKKLIIAKLQGNEINYHINDYAIIAAHDLAPNDTVNFDRKKILGMVVETGGKTSHSAILARSLEIPCVVGVPNLMTAIGEAGTMIIDGRSGDVIIHPEPEVLEDYKARKKHYEKIESDLLQESIMPVQSCCGENVELLANLELSDEIQAVRHVGAKGIGLLRTEGLFFEAHGLPEEEEQFGWYDKIARAMLPHPVTIRTMDFGGDKAIPAIVFPAEDNPFLGWRAIRFSLDSPNLFKIQLRAILRASRHQNVRIMLPFIAAVSEVTRSLELIETCKAELLAENLVFDEAVKVGIMIETPAAAMMTDLLAEEVDFFSIGTNDLTQYALAVDRGNEKIASLYDHFNPGVLRLIRQTIESAEKTGTPVSMCGEMAGDPLAIVPLLGMGLRSFSAAPIMLPSISKIIRETNIAEASRVTEDIFKLRNTSAIKAYLTEYAETHFRDFLF